MAELPIACNVQGDYSYKIIMVNEEDTITQVIQKALDGVVGYFIKEFPADTVLKASIHGSEKSLPGHITVKETNILKMEAIDIYVVD